MKPKTVTNAQAGDAAGFLITVMVFPWLIAAGCRWGGWVWGPPSVCTTIALWLFSWAAISAKVKNAYDRFRP